MSLLHRFFFFFGGGFVSLLHLFQGSPTLHLIPNCCFFLFASFYFDKRHPHAHKRIIYPARSCVLPAKHTSPPRRAVDNVFFFPFFCSAGDERKREQPHIVHCSHQAFLFFFRLLLQTRSNLVASILFRFQSVSSVKFDAPGPGSCVAEG